MAKRSIPRLALAALTLGGACGGDGKNSGNDAAKNDALEPAGQDATATRTDIVTKALCETSRQCAPADFKETYTSLDDCAKSLNDFFDDVVKDDEVCKDALLDYYGCIAKLSCEAGADDQSDELAGCETLYDKADEVCDLEDDYGGSGDEDYGDDDY